MIFFFPLVKSAMNPTESTITQVFPQLPVEVAARIHLLATASPTARCFNTNAEDEWTRDVIEAFREGKAFHANKNRCRLLQLGRKRALENLWFSSLDLSQEEEHEARLEYFHRELNREF